jgi:hypothetical protein
MEFLPMVQPWQKIREHGRSKKVKVEYLHESARKK